ncbi:MAG: zinc metallopeptidase [Holophagales bacterium]|nr:zinc metallopeptidase [Holophagales bacterium]
MRWRGERQSQNVEDRRGRGPAIGRGAGLGCGGLIVVLAISWLTGANPLQLLQVAEQMQPPAASVDGGVAAGGAPNDELGQFAATVLGSTEEVWGRLFAAQGATYRPPTLVLFDGAVQSACGLNSAAVGPFYCPGDQKVYLDLSFFDELSRRFGAPGDFADAYVIAHEVGHHVQNLLGYSEAVTRAQQQARSREEANEYSVRLELMADCLAGVWAYHAHRDRNLLEPGDIEEGLTAASAIGDDRMQKMATGRVQPESWTHGSSQMRVAWLRKGLESGDPGACETFER